MENLMSIVAWFFFVIFFWWLGKFIAEKKECVLEVNLPKGLLRILGLSKRKNEIGIFICIYLVSHYILSLGCIVLFVYKMSKIGDICELYFYLECFSMLIWLVLNQIFVAIRNRSF